MASPEPAPEPALAAKSMVTKESAVKDLLRRLTAESQEQAEKAAISEPTTPTATGGGVKLEKATNRGIEARAVAGLRDAIQSSKALEELVEVVRDAKSLELHHGSIGDKGVSSLSRAFRDANVANLLSLDLSDNGLTDQGFHELSQTIATGFLSGLERFNLSHNHLREEGSGMLARILHIGRLPSLLSLNLSHCYIGDYGAKNIANAMQSPNFSSWGLQFLDMSTNSFGEEGAVALLNTLTMGRLPYLKHLNLSFNMVGEKGTLALAEALNSKQLSGLTELILARCYLGKGVVPVTQVLEAGRVAGLEVLDLSCNHIGEQGSVALAKALRSGKLAQLRKLVIAECGISPPGIEMVADALQVGRVWSLQQLDMSSNFVNSSSTRDLDFRDRYMENYTHERRDIGAFALARMIRSGHLTEMRHLNLSRVSMTDDGLVAIAEEMEAGRLRQLVRFILTDNDMGSPSSMKALVRALMSGNLPELQELDLGHNLVGEDLTMSLANALEDMHAENESPLVRKLREKQQMSKSPIENLLHKLLIFLETQLGISFRAKPSASNVFNRYWERQSSRSLPVSDEESVESTGNDSKLLFNVFLVLVWVVAVWISKW